MSSELLRAADVGSRPSDAERRALAALLPGPLVVVLGKGGVGRSAFSAALGLLLAASGRRTHLLEIDSRESLSALLGVAPSGGAVVAVDGFLTLECLRPRELVDRELAARIPLAWLTRRVLSSPVYQHFADGAPGLKEAVTLHHAQQRAAAPGSGGGSALPTVLLDAPATGHGLALLTAPRQVAAAVPRGPFGEMARALAALVADPQRCQLVVVTQAEEMPVEEAFELRAALQRELGVVPRLLAVNALAGDDTAGDPAAPGATPTVEPAALALWRRRHELQQHHLSRLRRGWRGARIELPLLPLEHGPELVRALSRRLGEALPLAEAGP